MPKDIEPNPSTVKQEREVYPCTDALQVAAVGGDRNAWFLLRAILRMLESVKRPARDGFKWTWYTRAEWMVITGLTKHEYDRALSILVRNGIVVCKHTPMTHIRIADGFQLPVRPGKAPDSDVPAKPGKGNDHLPGTAGKGNGHLPAKPGNPIDMKEADMKKEDGKGSEAAPAGTAHPPVSCVSQGSKQGSKTEPHTQASSPVTGSAPLEKASNPLTPPPVAPAPSPLPVIGGGVSAEKVIAMFEKSLATSYARMNLADAWKAAMHALGKVGVDYGDKGRGQLGTLAKAWSAGNPALVLFKCVVRWDDFTRYVRDHGEQNGKMVPFGMTADPSLAALVHPYNRQFAVDFAIKGHVPKYAIPTKSTVEEFHIDPETGDMLAIGWHNTKTGEIKSAIKGQCHIDPETGDMLPGFGPDYVKVLVSDTGEVIGPAPVPMQTLDVETGLPKIAA